MELFFQEKLSLNGKVVITDMNETPVYTGKNGVAFSASKTFLFDKDNKKIATILQGKTIFNSGYTIMVGKKKVAKMKQKISLVNQNFKVKGLDWDIKGNFTAREYTITKGDAVIAVIKRAKLISLLEGYNVNITNEEDAIVVMCIVLVLNKILAASKKSLLKK